MLVKAVFSAFEYLDIVYCSIEIDDIKKDA